MKSNLKPYVRIVVNHSQKCNMKCTWCHEEGMQLTSTATLLAPDKISRLAGRLYRLGTRKFKLVGGEPTLRNDLPEIIAGLRAMDETIDISMVTNGSRLASLVSQYTAAGLDRVNVSVFSMDEDFFRRNVGPASLMGKVTAGVDAAVALGVCGKINHVYHNVNDLKNVLAFARERRVRVNVLNQIPSLSSPVGMPAGELLAILNGLPVASVEEEVDPYSLPVTVMRLHDGTEIEVKHQEVGAQAKFASCSSCQSRPICKEGIFALRITPAGRLQPCIVRDDNTFDLLAEQAENALPRYLAEL